MQRTIRGVPGRYRGMKLSEKRGSRKGQGGDDILLVTVSMAQSRSPDPSVKCNIFGTTTTEFHRKCSKMGSKWIKMVVLCIISHTGPMRCSHSRPHLLTLMFSSGITFTLASPHWLLSGTLPCLMGLYGIGVRDCRICP